MKTAREEFEPGTSSVEDFWRFVAERHAVWIRRVAGEPAPWTDDKIIAGHKFTNIFRELDRGTIALRQAERAFCPASTKLMREERVAGLIFFNVAWYRMLNRAEHIEAVGGFVREMAPLAKLCRKAEPLFTSAHQTYLPKGVGPGAGVREWYLGTFRDLWKRREALAREIIIANTLEGAFEVVRGCVTGIGPFIAYEIVTDLRRTLLRDAHDKMKWCNINRGGGSARGLRRLGYGESPSEAWRLLNDGINKKLLPPHLAQHLPAGMGGAAASVAPLLELREVEHALCEFDKYERCRTGLGTTRGGAYRPDRKKFDDGGFGAGVAVLQTPAWSGSPVKAGRKLRK